MAKGGGPSHLDLFSPPRVIASPGMADDDQLLSLGHHQNPLTPFTGITEYVSEDLGLAGNMELGSGLSRTGFSPALQRSARFRNSYATPIRDRH